MDTLYPPKPVAFRQAWFVACPPLTSAAPTLEWSQEPKKNPQTFQRSTACGNPQGTCWDVHLSSLNLECIGHNCIRGAHICMFICVHTSV